MDAILLKLLDLGLITLKVGDSSAMSRENSVEIVHAFWDEVCNAHDPEAADRFVTDDFVIVTGGETISGRENFKKWIEGFLAKLTDLHLQVIESFQNADGSRVTSRWLTNWVERASWEQFQRLKI